MTNNEITVENLENLTEEQLDAEAARLDAEDSSKKGEGEGKVDWENTAKIATKRAAILQRLLNKKPKTITTNESKPATEDVTKDIQEIKFYRKVDSFAEEHGLTKAQAEKVLKYHPDATAETLKDPFIAQGIKAIARKERVENAMPGSGKAPVVNGKTFKEMNRDERMANFGKVIESLGGK